MFNPWALLFFVVLFCVLFCFVCSYCHYRVRRCDMNDCVLQRFRLEWYFILSLEFGKPSESVGWLQHVVQTCGQGLNKCAVLEESAQR